MVKDMAVEAFGFDEVLRNLGSSDLASEQSAPDTRILRELQVIAEEACNMARDTYPSRASGGYDDHTRNLRGSIGFRINFRGEEVVRGGFDGRGSEIGENAANGALSKTIIDNSTWEIIIVAGMEYARYVEAKGYNVISFVQNYLDEQISKLKQDIKKGNI
jgi:hypothetical protein